MNKEEQKFTRLKNVIRLSKRLKKYRLRMAAAVGAGVLAGGQWDAAVRPVHVRAGADRLRRNLWRHSGRGHSAGRGALAGGSIDDKRVVTAFDKSRGKCLRAVEVEFALIVEGRDHSGDQATEAGFNVRHGRLLNSCMRLPAIKARRRTYARFIYYAKVHRADYASCMKFSKPTIRPSRAPTLLIPSKTPGM